MTADGSITEMTPELIDDFVYLCRVGDDIQELLSQVPVKWRKELILSTNDHGLNSLFAVCGNGYELHLVQFLEYLSVEDINQQNKEGNTPLHWACLNGHLEMVKKLLELGCNPLIRNQNGMSAATLAEQRGHMEVVTLVLQHYDPEDEDDEGVEEQH
jgi:ankyrin repeat protein